MPASASASAPVYRRIRTRALIIGGGVAGPAAALFVHRIGVEPLVFEAQPGPAEDGAALTLAPNGMAMMAHLGLAEAVLQAGSPIDRFAFHSGDGRRLGSMDYAPPGRYAHPGVSVNRRTLYRIMLDALRERGIAVAFGKSIQKIDQDCEGVLARFADGEEVWGDFLIGADGIRSTVRRLIMPQAPEPQFTGLVGAGGFVPRSVVQKILGPSGQTTMGFFFGKGGFVGYALGNRHDDNGAYWWNAIPCDHPPTPAERETLAGPEGARSFLAQDKDWAPEVRALVGATTRHLGPFAIYDVASLPNWSSQRVVLIGDAAHAVSPHSGQGASQALEDALVLTKALRAHLDVKPAFAAFEAERRPRTDKVIAFGRRSGDAKRKGPVAAMILRLLMPLFLKFAPQQRWLYGYDPGWAD